MENSLLIHHDNVVSESEFADEKYFDADDNIDKYISQEIIPYIKKSTCKTLYIKDNLSSNYMELLGIRIAYHVRLSETLENKRYMPIVIISELDGYLLGKLSSEASILFTKNIYVIKNDGSQKTHHYEDLTSAEYKSGFLNLITVEPPENSSSHSIANKWAIYRWAEYLKVESEAITTNKDAISSMLYFKYLTALNPSDKNKGIGIKIPKQEGKVLYIDDEWAKGWGDIFETYFSKIKNFVTFETFKYDFKDVDIDTLTKKIKDMVNSNEPDLIMLDLRLVENDHNETNREDVAKYTGIEILKMIKEINPGIQVIMFTATSKSMILEELYNHDIVGYIKKEHPKDTNVKTKESFEKLARLVDVGLEKKYLKSIWNIQNSILSFDIFNKKEEFRLIKIEILSIYEILDSDINNSYKYAMLAIFKCVESINNYCIGENRQNGHSVYFKNNKATIADLVGDGKLTTERNKILNILKRLQLNRLKDTAINIVNTRNDTIHSNGKPPYIDKDDIEKWFTMLHDMIEKINDRA